MPELSEEMTSSDTHINGNTPAATSDNHSQDPINEAANSSESTSSIIKKEVFPSLSNDVLSKLKLKVKRRGTGEKDAK